MTYIFDLDGTLINSMPDIAAAMNHVREHFGLNTLGQDEYLRRVGWGLAELVRRSLPDVYVNEGIILIKKYYLKHPFRYAQAFSGISELLLNLQNQGHNVGILTNKDHQVTLKIAEHFFPFINPEHVLGANNGYETKPNPAGLLHLIKTIGDTPENTVMIGDSEHDLETARAAGTAEIALSYGNREKKLLASYAPAVILDTVEDLHSHITQHSLSGQFV